MLLQLDPVYTRRGGRIFFPFFAVQKPLHLFQSIRAWAGGEKMGIICPKGERMGSQAFGYLDTDRGGRMDRDDDDGREISLARSPFWAF